MEKMDLVWLAKNRLAVFPKYVSGNLKTTHLNYIADKIQTAVCSPVQSDKYKLLLIDMPPRHGKTSLVSVHFPVWYLGNYPTRNIIMSSYADSLATTNSAKARDLFEYWGQVLWDVSLSPTVSGKEEWNTERGGGVKATGVGGACTGYGADVFIIDDYLKNHEEAHSDVIREKIWQWWKFVVISRLHPNATVIILATRWHEDDLVGRILKDQKDCIERGDDFEFEIEHITLPALAEENDPLGRVKGEALFPHKYSRARLLNIEKAVGPYAWSALYRGNPTPRGGNLWKTQWFRYWEMDYTTKTYICHRPGMEPLRIPERELTRHVYIDPAIEIKKVNDPSGFGAWGYNRRHKVWLLLDVISDRIEHTRLQETALNFALKNKCLLIGVENEKLGKVMVKQSAGHDEIGGKKIPFKEIPTGGLDKYARAVPMATYTENGRVFFKRDAPWLAPYESCLVKFPNVKHDEYVDITSMAANMESTLSVTDALANH